MQIRNKYRKDIACIVALTAFFVVIIALVTKGKYMYGSTTDWQNQYWVFSDYFRKLFYSTHDLFPNFALQVGAGQNIYNFSYYGLYNPIILISYLLPFVGMMDYIMASSIVVVIISVSLFYFWLKSHRYERVICFSASFLFLCAAPLTFQSHRQIMFMDYMPFLLIALFGMDQYFRKKRGIALIIGVFLMVLTSYYFSVGGLAVLAIYAIYKYLQEYRFRAWKTLFLHAFNVAARMLLGVLLASFLLLPTLSALLSGRSSTLKGTLFGIGLFVPDLSASGFLYSSYTVGLTAIAIVAVVMGLLRRNKADFFLSAVIVVAMLFPIFRFILNGGLYLDEKVFIPFLPITCLPAAAFFRQISQGKIRMKSLVAAFAVLGVILFQSRDWSLEKLFLIDSAVTAAAVIVFTKLRNKFILYIPIIAIAAFVCLNGNLKDELLSAVQKNHDFSAERQAVMEMVQDKDSGFYRTVDNVEPLADINLITDMGDYQSTVYSSIYNKTYYGLYYDLFNNEMTFRNSLMVNATDNILFHLYMGTKYFVTENNPPVGYKLVGKKGFLSVYENKDVFPLGYVTDHLMSESEFSKLEYPYNIEALLRNAVVSTGNNTDSTTDIEPVSDPVSNISSVTSDGLTCTQASGGYNISATEGATMSLQLKKPIKSGQILILRFRMANQEKYNDTAITINGVKNKLTCSSWKYQNNNYEFDYVLSSGTDTGSLDLTFQEGDYEIRNIQAYTLDYSSISSLSSEVDPFEVDMDQTKGDVIEGTVNAKKDGYFILNVPYDKGFHITVDGKSITYEKANEAFIGFPIAKGKHVVQVEYAAPGLKAGMVASVAAAAVFLVFIFCTARRKKREK